MGAVPADLLMMLLGDARLPVAGHTQSATLEGGVQGGLTATEVPLYIAARLSTTIRVEAGTAVVARHHFAHQLPLEPVVRAWAARVPSAAMRRSSRTQARALLRVSGRLWPESAAVAAAASIPGVPRAVALGAVAVAVGLGPQALARLIGYDDVQTVASAALKLLPLDPVDACRWVHDALAGVSEAADAVWQLTEPGRIPATAAPQTELWAEAHGASTRRLFSA
jgi:urease accessory protein